MVGQRHECMVLGVRVESTADAVDSREFVDRFSIKSSLEVDVIEAVLLIEPVHHPLFDRLNNHHR